MEKPAATKLPRLAQANGPNETKVDQLVGVAAANTEKALQSNTIDELGIQFRRFCGKGLSRYQLIFFDMQAQTIPPFRTDKWLLTDWKRPPTSANRTFRSWVWQKVWFSVDYLADLHSDLHDRRYCTSSFWPRFEINAFKFF